MAPPHRGGAQRPGGVGRAVGRGTRSPAALRAADIEHLRFHDLRPTFGTLALQEFALSDVKAYVLLVLDPSRLELAGGGPALGGRVVRAGDGGAHER